MGDADSPASRQARWTRWVGVVLLAGAGLAGALAAMVYALRILILTVRSHLRAASQRTGWLARSQTAPPFFKKLLTMLDRAGFRRPAGTPPLTFVRGIAPALGPAAGDVEMLIRLAYRTRFGGHPLSPTENHAALRRLKALYPVLPRVR